jgi:hypothetical protein
LFAGIFSLRGDAVEASAVIHIDSSGELVFEFTPIPYSEQSEFISTAWHATSSDAVHFSFKAVAEGGARFETDDLFFSSLAWPLLKTQVRSSRRRQGVQADDTIGAIAKALERPALSSLPRMGVGPGCGWLNAERRNSPCEIILLAAWRFSWFISTYGFIIFGGLFS